MTERGESATNPNAGFVSILTKFRREFSAIKSGADELFQANVYCLLRVSLSESVFVCPRTFKNKHTEKTQIQVSREKTLQNHTNFRVAMTFLHIFGLDWT